MSIAIMRRINEVDNKVDALQAEMVKMLNDLARQIKEMESANEERPTGNHRGPRTKRTRDGIIGAGD